MAKLNRLVRVLHGLTAIPAFAIERTADKLAEANHLPSGGGDLLPEDVAALIVALAASRAPTEAVEVVDAYLGAPLVASSIVTNGGEFPVDLGDESLDLNCNPDLAPAKEHVVGCLGLLIGEITGQRSGTQRGVITVEIRRSIAAPFASVFVKTGETMRRFVFTSPRSQEVALSWQQWQQVDDQVFAAVAELFDEIGPAVSEALPAVIH